MALGVFDEVAVLEKVRRHEVFEARALGAGVGPVVEVELLFFLHGTDARTPKRRDAEGEVHLIEDREPVFYGVVRNLEVLADALERERRPHSRRERIDQEVEQRDLFHALERQDVLVDDALVALVLPFAPDALAAGEERLRETAEAQEITEVAVGLGDGEWMEPEVLVAAEERVAAFAVEVEPGRAGHDDFLLVLVRVVDALEEVPPARELVELVVDDDRFCRWQVSAEDGLAEFDVVIVEVPRRPFFEERSREGRLADLPRTAEEDHLIAV